MIAMNTRIFLVRHGITIGNEKEINQGTLDYELSGQGKKQAKALAKRLSKIRFHAIYSSNLKRATKTAGEIAKHQKCMVIHSKLLAERNFGKFEGKRYGTVEKYRHDPLLRPPGGESIKDALDRAKPLLRQILKKNKGKTVLIVAHGTIGRAILCYFLGIPINLATLFGTLKNTSITEIEFFLYGPRLMRLNDHAHLED